MIIIKKIAQKAEVAFRNHCPKLRPPRAGNYRQWAGEILKYRNIRWLFLPPSSLGVAEGMFSPGTRINGEGICTAGCTGGTVTQQVGITGAEINELKGKNGSRGARSLKI